MPVRFMGAFETSSLTAIRNLANHLVP